MINIIANYDRILLSISRLFVRNATIIFLSFIIANYVVKIKMNLEQNMLRLQPIDEGKLLYITSYKALAGK